MLGVYKEFAETCLAIPVFTGRKTEKEKFAGAVATFGMRGDDARSARACRRERATISAKTSPRRSTSNSSTKTARINMPTPPRGGLSTRLIGALIMGARRRARAGAAARRRARAGHPHPHRREKGGGARGGRRAQGAAARRRHPRRRGQERQQPRLEVQRVGDEGRAPAHRAGPARHRGGQDGARPQRYARKGGGAPRKRRRNGAKSCLADIQTNLLERARKRKKSASSPPPPSKSCCAASRGATSSRRAGAAAASAKTRSRNRRQLLRVSSSRMRAPTPASAAAKRPSTSFSSRAPIERRKISKKRFLTQKTAANAAFTAFA